MAHRSSPTWSGNGDREEYASRSFLRRGHYEPRDVHVAGPSSQRQAVDYSDAPTASSWHSQHQRPRYDEYHRQDRHLRNGRSSEFSSADREAERARRRSGYYDREEPRRERADESAPYQANTNERRYNEYHDDRAVGRRPDHSGADQPRYNRYHGKGAPATSRSSPARDADRARKIGSPPRSTVYPRKRARDSSIEKDYSRSDRTPRSISAERVPGSGPDTTTLKLKDSRKSLENGKGSEPYRDHYPYRSDWGGPSRHEGPRERKPDSDEKNSDDASRRLTGGRYTHSERHSSEAVILLAEASGRGSAREPTDGSEDGELVSPRVLARNGRDEGSSYSFMEAKGQPDQSNSIISASKNISAAQSASHNLSSDIKGAAQSNTQVADTTDTPMVPVWQTIAWPEDGDESRERRIPKRLRPTQIPLRERTFYGCSSIDQYNMGVKLGQGTFGEVKKASHFLTGIEVALKKVTIHEEKDGMPITAIREIKLLKKLKHPSIVPVIDMAYRAPVERGRLGEVYMVEPYMDHDLNGMLENPSIQFTIAQIKLYMKQLLEGTLYLHQNKILHRDMKAANLLINNRGQLQIADFGLARPYHDPGKAWESKGWNGGTTGYTSMVVTRWYRPPELLAGDRRYGPPIDMWGLGCILAEMVLRKPIFNGSSEIEQLELIAKLCGSPNEHNYPGWHALPGVKDADPNMRPDQDPSVRGRHDFGNYPRRVLEHFTGAGGPVSVRRELADLIDKLLVLNPCDRLTAKEALEHEWFWQPPFPADPDALPTYQASKELDRQRRDQQRHEQQRAAHAQAQLHHQQQQHRAMNLAKAGISQTMGSHGPRHSNGHLPQAGAYGQFAPRPVHTNFSGPRHSSQGGGAVVPMMQRESLQPARGQPPLPPSSSQTNPYDDVY